MTLQRLPNWPALLAAEIEAARDRPFAWGSHDCALFVCNCILAITGQDFAERFRGQYKTERGAKYQLARRGYDTFEALARSRFGDPLETVRLAGRGDPVFVSNDLGFACGVVDLNGREFVAVSTDGLEHFPIDLATLAWRVG